MSEMFGRISQKYGVRIGIDLGAKSPSHPISVDVAQGTVADLFNATIAQAPGYKWTEVHGVVNVTPERGANTVLDLTIAHFEVRHATPMDLHFTIRSLPEVKDWLKQSELTESTIFGWNILIGTNGVTSLPRVSLNLHNMILRDILNRIVESPGFSFWYVGRYGDRNQYLTINID